jgi:hypothetical protein
VANRVAGHSARKVERVVRGSATGGDLHEHDDVWLRGQDAEAARLENGFARRRVEGDGSPRASSVVEPVGFEPVPSCNCGDGGAEIVVEFVEGVDVGGGGAYAPVGDVCAADHDDGTDESASFKFGTDVDEVGLDFSPVEWSACACHGCLRCSAEARIQTL